jgi:hypothetical protein
MKTTTTYLEFLQERNLLSRSLLLSLSEEILSTISEHITSFLSLKLPLQKELKERYQDGFFAILTVPKEVLFEIISNKDKELGNKVERDLLFVFSDEKTKTLNQREHFNTLFNSIRLFSKKKSKISILSSLKENNDLLLHELGHFFQTLKKPDSNSLPSALAHYSEYNKYGEDAYSLSYFFDDEELDAELFKIEKKLKGKEGKPTYREFLSSLLDDPYFAKFKEIISYLLEPDSKDMKWKKLFRKMAYKIDKVFKFSFSEKKRA